MRACPTAALLACLAHAGTALLMLQAVVGVATGGEDGEEGLPLPPWMQSAPAGLPRCVPPPLSINITADVAGGCDTDAPAASLAKARASAWRWAPRVSFHPDERYFLDSAARYLDASVLFGPNGEHLGPATPANVRRQIEAGFANATCTVATWDVGNWSGMPLDSNNMSTAPIYANVYLGQEGQWVYNFWLYYSWNPPSSFQVNRQRQEGGRWEWLDVLFDGGYGLHEGDWESVTVEMCPDLSRPLKQVLRTHWFNSAYDCTKNECEFAPGSNGTNTTHMDVLCALGGHASYQRSKEASEVMYSVVNASSDLVMPCGIHALTRTDRTWAPEEGAAHFQPTEENVIVLDAPSDVDWGDASADANATWQQLEAVGLHPWSAYPGRWGLAYYQDVHPVGAPMCYTDGQSDIVSCSELRPEDASALPQNIFDVTSALANADEAIANQSAADGAALVAACGHVDPSFWPRLVAFGPLGPAFKTFWDEVEVAVPSPLQAETGGVQLACPDYAHHVAV